VKRTPLVLLVLGILARAQDPIALKDAVRIALVQNKSLLSAAAGRNAADARIGESRAGYWPKVAYSESWARSNNPVFVFSSLLTQSQFKERNFALDPLNRPGFLNNFQSQLTAEQTLYDGGRTKRTVRSAELMRDIAGTEVKRTEQEVTAGAVASYIRVLLTIEQLSMVQQTLRSAESDLKLAEDRRAAGFSTDAEVLAIRVHLAGVREQRIRRAADLEVARSELNDALGLPLDTQHTLTTSLHVSDLPGITLAEYEDAAVRNRPEALQAKLATSLARNQVEAARSNLMPQVGFRAAFEADRQRFYDRGSSNWLAAVQLNWNLFNGFADKARIDAGNFALRRGATEEERTGSAIRLQVRRAYADLRSSEARIEVAKASVEESHESLRIIQNRYGAGMSTVTDLLRAETAVQEARTRYLAAVHDQRIAAVMLEMAAGRLTPDSEALN
jgi:outer membrane protein